MNNEREITCPRCKGTGQIPDPEDKHGMMMPCPKCKRFGWIYKDEE